MVDSRTYPHEGVVSNNPIVEDEVPKRCDNDGASEAVESKLPCLFAFACACIYACHQEDYVQRRERIEYLTASASPVGLVSHLAKIRTDLEGKVPRVPAIRRCRGREDVKIARAEYESIKSLCDERDTCWLRQSCHSRDGLLSSPSALLLE
jgi:hypothetical protein